MTIRNPVLFGLKVDFNFTDALSKNSCLENLGLKIEDLDVIRGIGDTSLTKIDLQNVSGLDINLTRYLDRLKSDTSLYSDIILKRGGYQNTLQGNFEAYGPISGGSIRFNYIANDVGSGLTTDNLKFGDISTSRVSSWSSATSDETDVEQPISYGASVQVRGALKIGQKENFQPSTIDSIINVLDTPEPIRFATEVATDILKIKINGVDRYVYAMRGIPVVFTTAFKNLALDLQIIPIADNPIYTIKDTDDENSQEIQSTPNLISGNTSQLRYNAPTFKERLVKIYFPPNNIELLRLKDASLIELPPVKFLRLQRIELDDNLISEIPDFTTLNYTYDISSPQNPPNSTLTYISLNKNPLLLSENPEYSRWGTYPASRLPKTLQTLLVDGTFAGEQDWQNIENFVVVNATQTEFNSIECDPKSEQTYSFIFDLQGGGTQTTEITGIYYDKLNFGTQNTTYRYVYIKDPTTTINEPVVGTDWEQFVKTRYSGSSEKLSVLDLSTRCPNLKVYRHVEALNRRLFKTPLSKYPDIDNNNLFDYVTGNEYSPKVELRSIENYTVTDNRFTKLNPIFISPQNYLGVGESSTLKIINLSSGGISLTEPDGAIDFNRMTDIETINFNFTNLSIPIGLASKSELRSLNFSRTRFPSRPTSSISPAYSQAHPDGGFVNPTTGEGNPSGLNNHFFSSKFPVNQGEYRFINCGKLETLSFYNSFMDGMIPKFVGNTELRTLDLRNTRIEGGRPPMPTNNGISGRRFVMWDDTFADCTNTLRTLRLSGPNIGRNIGIYDSSTQQYTEAAFQGSTFNLPFLTRLEIISTGRYLKGSFFSVSNLNSLQYLYSYNSGWGEDLPNGTPLPTLAGKNSLRDVRLYGNNFSGQINLDALPSLQRILLQNNILNGFGTFTPGNSLKQFSAFNNSTLTGALPNFSVGSPNIETIALGGCNLNAYVSGAIVDLPRLRSLDLSDNNLNSSSVDAILVDALANYNANRRSGVVINLNGNAPPSRQVIQIPTTNTTSSSYTITVQQPPLFTDPVFQDNFTQVYEYDDNGTAIYSLETSLTIDGTLQVGTLVLPTSAGEPLTIVDANLNVITNPNPTADQSPDLDVNGQAITTTPSQPIPRLFTFFTRGANGLASQGSDQLDLKTGVDPNNPNISYSTKIFQDNVNITSSVTIDFINNSITFPQTQNGGGFPQSGTKIRFVVDTTVEGFITEIVGGVNTVNTLRSNGWIIRTS